MTSRMDIAQHYFAQERGEPRIVQSDLACGNDSNSRPRLACRSAYVVAAAAGLWCARDRIRRSTAAMLAPEPAEQFRQAAMIDVCASVEQPFEKLLNGLVSAR